MEAPSGFEPEMEVLQTSALPLGDGADRKRIPRAREHRIVPDAPQAIKAPSRACLSRCGRVWYNSFFYPASGNNSVVECDLAKVEVAGSNPVSRSIFRLVSRTPHSSRRPTRNDLNERL